MINECNTNKESPKNESHAKGVVNETLAKISGKVISVIAGLLITILTLAYTNISTRITTLEDRTTNLYTEKVSRSEFAQQMNQLRLQNEAMKTDILSRLDLILKIQNKD